jgi:hypothetical protein
MDARGLKKERGGDNVRQRVYADNSLQRRVTKIVREVEEKREGEMRLRGMEGNKAVQERHPNEEPVGDSA